MRTFAARHSIPYVSLIALLCADRHCPVVGPDGELFIRDYGHWTMNAVPEFARIFVANKVLGLEWPVADWMSAMPTATDNRSGGILRAPSAPR